MNNVEIVALCDVHIEKCEERKLQYGDSRIKHYHSSRYHFLNLHSFFTGNHTVELRGFNSELHAGKIRSYIVLALALNNQALRAGGILAKRQNLIGYLEKQI